MEVNVDGVKLKNHPLTNIELEHACKLLKIPIRGIFMRDNLPAWCRKDECAIINLDESCGSVTHWVCYVKQGTTTNYFDSLGLAPPLELQKYIRVTLIAYSTYQIQSPEQVICGHLCLHVLNRLKDKNVTISLTKLLQIYFVK